ncbi:MAG: HEPN domain-containing protein [archaeon]
MDKLKRIVSDRQWYHTSAPLKVFEGRLKDMIFLEGTILTQKNMNSSTKNEARKQYVIMLVTCYETYTREMFKILINEELVAIPKIKKMKDVKFAIEEIEYIKKNNIELSELLAEYINFQNFEEVLEIFKNFGLNKKIDESLNNRDGVMPLPDSIFKNKKIDSETFVIEFFKQMTLHNKIDKEYLFHQIRLLLGIRHKIIHKNIDITIEQEDLLTFTLAIYEIVMILDRFVQDMTSSPP